LRDGFLSRRQTMSDIPQRAAPKPLFFGLGLCLLTLVVFLPVLRSEFVNFDDGLYVVNNTRVQAGLTWSGFIWAWQASVASNWHPLTMLSHMLDCQLYGLNPKGHHLTSLLLHLAAVWLLFEVLRRMTGYPWRSAAVAALFAVHPLHVESVAWVAERKDVLSGLFFVLTLGAWLRFTRRRTAGAYAAVVLMLALGLLAKSMLVTLPCVLLLVDVWPLGRLPILSITSWSTAKPALRPLLIEKIPLFVLAAVMSGLTVYTQTRSLAKLAAVPLARRFGNALTSYAAYLGKTFWPRRLAAFYPLPNAVPLWQAAAAALLLAAVTALVLLRLRRSPWLAVGWLWFVGMLVPVIGILQVGRQAMADRYTYLPSIGLFLALVWEVAELSSRRKAARAALPAAAVAILAALAVLCRIQVDTWKDSRTLFSHAVAVTEGNYLAHLNLGVAMAREGDEAGAMKEYRTALAIQPNMIEAQAALGTALHKQGRSAEALPHLQLAVRLRPDSARLRQTLAVTLEDLGRRDEAVVQLRKALELSPRFADAHYGLGSLLQKQGKTGEALQHYQKALEIDPDLDELYSPTATLLAARGDLLGAVRLFAESVQRRPDSPLAAYNLAVTLERLGKIDDARVYYARALELDPNLTAARERLMMTGGAP
jgi:tetratricopeptide (TPR) repeat protein